MRKKNSIAEDPFAAREALRYEQPIPSREFILGHLAHRAKPIKDKELAKELKLKDEVSIEALRRRLKAMLRDGQVIKIRGDYALASEQRTIVGRLKLEREGSGSVLAAAALTKIWLSPREIKGLCDGDLLEIRVTHTDNRGQSQARVVRVVEAKTPRLVGRYHAALPTGYIEPRHRLYRMTFSVSVAQGVVVSEGDWVVVQMIRGHTGREDWQGEVIERLGDMVPLDLEMATVIEAHQLPREWPEAVLKSLATLPNQVTASAKRYRLDLRSAPLVTIDGEDARDFDDAVYCEARPRGLFRLWVAIADVGHYVKASSPLDAQARLRGNSVYFPNTVIPMLPEKLSNGLCSLNPDEDRLCIVCELTISAKGTIMASAFHKAIMRSKARLTYTKVAAMLAGDEALQQEYKTVWPHLQVLHELFKVLHQQRQLRGAIEFETIETRVMFDQQGSIEKIIPVVRNVAHRIIEECMLLANVAAAKFLIKETLPTLFRVHAGPNADKLRDLRSYLGLFGLTLGGKERPTPKHYGQLVTEIAKRPDAHILQTVMLRSLSQAVYTPNNLGHFGLAYPAYTHFTSPIRRYPDLVVHRAIVAAIEGKRPKGSDDLVVLGEHCSITERRADDASREVLLAMKCHYMQKHLGDDFEAIVTGVTSFGLFAELQGLYVEGLIHISSLGNDYYVYDQTRYQLKGERTGITFNIGDRLFVRVARVDVSDRKLDFELLWDKMAKSQEAVKPEKKPQRKQKKK